MDQADWLAARFEEQRSHLRAVAYRMLGSLAEADDAVQNSWLRLNGASTAEVGNLAGWLTTVVARECLKMLRSRRVRREEALPEGAAEPTASDQAGDPEAAALMADSVGLAIVPQGRLLGALGFTFTGDMITEIDMISDPEHLRRVDLAALSE
jgi:DNA-directed RNA polymerase specialized sigma24 family protein